MTLNRRYAHRLAVSTAMALLFVLPGVTKGLQWEYEPNREGTMTVEATKDGAVFGPVLFTGTVAPGGKCSGTLPDEANDFQISFAATDGSGLTVEQFKVGLIEVVENPAEIIYRLLEFARVWKIKGPRVEIPVLARKDAPLTAFVDLGPVSGVIIFDGYEVVEGRCTELPGYLFGTTPLEYDPTVRLDESPFRTTPFTGTVSTVGKLILSEPVATPVASGWGLVIVVLLLLTAGALAIVRRRHPAVHSLSTRG